MKNHFFSQWSRTDRRAAYSVAFALLSLLTVQVKVQAQTLTTLHSFNGTDGSYPNVKLVQARVHRHVKHPNGNFYSVTPLGGSFGGGTVFQLTPAGALTTIYNFCSIGGSACTDGANPEGALVVGNDGNLYGTTFTGGSNNAGTVFKLTTSGALTTLYNFCSKASCADGSGPLGALMQGNDGNFYGTTNAGGAANVGTAFVITSGGALTTIHSFNSTADGANPEGDLVQGSWDGNFYGAAYDGGVNNAGTAFKLTPSGTLTKIYDFCSATNCNDGANPQVPFVKDPLGNLYGTTSSNGANAGGTVFRIGALFANLHTIYHFCSETNCADGANPTSGPLLGMDGELYGTTAIGGTNNAGTIYNITLWGVRQTLYSFCSQANCADGSSPEGALAQDTTGVFYGTTTFGGASNQGTVFSLSAPTPSNGVCNGSYYGNFVGNLVVNAGQTCEWSNGGAVFGNIFENGGNLILNNATVLGNVEIHNGTYALGPSLTVYSRVNVENIPSGAAQNTICGVSIRGSLYVDGNGTAAQIGSNAGACAGNTVGGEIEIDNNTALVQVFNNSVRDDLECDGNSSITGGGNTARRKIDQCATF